MSSDAPKLSIITVCRNESKRMIPTCESVASQTWQDFEWIVVDGASTDDTLEVLAPYRKRMAHLVSEPDSGIYDAMNKGIRLAKGEFVLLLNGGDSLHHPGTLGEVFNRDTSFADIMYGKLTVVKKNGGRSTVCPPKKIRSPRYFIANTLPHPSSFIRRELFERYGYYDTQLRINSDWKQWVIFALNHCRFRYIDVCVSCFDEQGISNTHIAQTRQEWAQVCSEYFTPGEMQGVSPYRQEKWIKLFFFLPLLKIRSSRGKKTYSLFGILPIFSHIQRF